MDLREYDKREKEREDMIELLNRGNREINKNMNEFEGWAGRIMKAIGAGQFYTPSNTKTAHYKREQ